MMHHIVSTEQFYEQMKRPAFVRLTKLDGRVDQDIYHTKTAPEDVPGLIEPGIVTRHAFGVMPDQDKARRWKIPEPMRIKYLASEELNKLWEKYIYGLWTKEPKP